MIEIKYSDFKDRIWDKLSVLNIQEPYYKIDGFINLPLTQQINEEIIIGGRFIPCVSVVGEKSGQVYFFALKAILDDPLLNQNKKE
jgi:hypothetical protein